MAAIIIYKGYEIHKTDNGYVSSLDGCWRPGSFADFETAQLATYCTDEELARLQERANMLNLPRLITLSDMKAVKRG